MPVELQILLSCPAKDGQNLTPGAVCWVGAPPLAVPAKAFNPLQKAWRPFQNETDCGESSRWRDKLNIWVALVIGD
jgi:hypothetical protein